MLTAGFFGLSQTVVTLPSFFLHRIACDMVRQIQVESQEDLLQRWQTCGILIQPTDGCERAPLKVSMETLRAHWQEHCMVIAIDRGAGRPKTLRASCWHFAHHGHCSHLYAVQQLEGLQTHIQPDLPVASCGQAALKQGAVPEYDCALGSSEDEAGRKKRKKRRKKPKSVCPGHGRKRGKSPVGHAPLAELVLELLADLVLEPLAERGLKGLRNSRADSRVLSRNTRPDAW